MKRASLTPGRMALQFKEERYTFKQLYEWAYCTAGKLHAAGVGKGDLVAVLMKNCPLMVAVLHALQLAGCRTLLLNIRLTETELLFQLEDSGAMFLVADREQLIHHQGLIRNFGGKILPADELERMRPEEFRPVRQFSLDEVCTMMYTSGTTGFPKGVLQTYGNHWWSSIGSLVNLGLNGDDVWLASVPLFHISGFSILIRSVVYGIGVYLFEKFDEEAVNKVLVGGKATIISVVPTMLKRMVDALGGRSYSSALRAMLVGGGPVPPHLLEFCRSKGIPAFQTYGMTETCSQICTLSPDEGFRRIGSAGKPLFINEIRIDQNGREAGPLEKGEILVKGLNVAKGYWNRDEANRTSFSSDGWFHTGDVGYLDREGFLYVVDRKKDVIISGGENIYPAEIENILESHPKVREAAVVGVPDELWGEVPCAFYVADGTVSGDELALYCEGKLAHYKIPKRWIAIDKLPKNAANKKLRRKLREYLAMDQKDKQLR